MSGGLISLFIQLFKIQVLLSFAYVWIIHFLNLIIFEFG